MDPNFDELLGLVGDLSEKLLKNPRGLEVFQKIKSREITEGEAVEALFQILREEGMLGEVMGASLRAQELLPAMGDSLIPVIQGDSGESVMNPLWEAAIIERTSLDGDVPELRHGPMPAEGTPAVPVLLDALDPIVAGMMLERASKEISQKLLRARKDHADLCGKILALTEKKSLESGTDPVLALEVARKHLPDAPSGISGYMAGESPAMMHVEKPTGAELLLVTEEEAQYYSHKALSTTQGRVSLATPISKTLLEKLRAQGIFVDSGTVKVPKARAQWVVASYGAGDFSPRFNYAESAVSAILTNLLKGLREENLGDQPLCLEVIPYNGISTRTFGWEARIGVRDV